MTSRAPPARPRERRTSRGRAPPRTARSAGHARRRPASCTPCPCRPRWRRHPRRSTARRSSPAAPGSCRPRRRRHAAAGARRPPRRGRGERHPGSARSGRPRRPPGARRSPPPAWRGRRPTAARRRGRSRAVPGLRRPEATGRPVRCRWARPRTGPDRGRAARARRSRRRSNAPSSGRRRPQPPGSCAARSPCSSARVLSVDRRLASGRPAGSAGQPGLPVRACPSVPAGQCLPVRPRESNAT